MDNICDRLYEDFNREELAFGYIEKDGIKHLYINAKETKVKWSESKISDNGSVKKELEDVLYKKLKVKVRAIIKKEYTEDDSDQCS